MPLNQLIIEQSDNVNHQFTDDDFKLSRWLSDENSVALSGGRGASQKILIQGQACVLRHYLRGGLVARVLHDQYLWTGHKHSRPYLERRAVQHALLHQLPVPEVVAYRIQQTGLIYRASIISQYINNQGTLATYLYDNNMPDDNWFALGELIRRLHQAGIFHADLNANNILINAEGNFNLIDFDKAEIVISTEKKLEKNIQRLLRSVKKIQGIREQQKLPFHFTTQQWNQFLAGYR